MFAFPFLKKSKKRGAKSFWAARDIEPQEIFLDEIARKKEEEFVPPERRFEVPLSQKSIFGFLILCLFIFFFVKTFQFQILERENFLARAEENKFIIHFIKSDRGVIYDKDGEQIVFNKPSFSLFLDEKKLPENRIEREEILSEISGIVERDIEELKKEISRQESGFFLIFKNIPHEKLIILESRISEFPGFEIQKSTVREYKDGELFSHIIGYTGRIDAGELAEAPEFYSTFDYVGRAGIEKTYEDILRKNPGKLRIERDALGNQISKEIISLPESGKSLILHLDSDLQKKIEQEIKDTMQRIGAKKGVGVALNPKNGAVLALVSLPSFDNNIFSQDDNLKDINSILEDKNEPLFNRAIAGKYVTGSTIKPLIALAALEEGIISPVKTINCQGKISIEHRYDPDIVYDIHDWTIHGLTDMRKAIAESCNVYFFTIGGGYEDQSGLGPSRIKKYLELFNWGNKTGIDLFNECKGFIPSPEWKKEVKEQGWWDGDTYNLSIGQGDIMITPIQVAAAFSAVANKGTLYKPKVVKEIVDNKKNIIEKIEPEIIRENFVDMKNLEIVREGMRRAVTGYNAPQASSVLLNSLPVSSAAKTGTAQTPLPDYYHNWVTVFAPYEDPEIVLTIMIENVYEAQVAALPTAKNILEWYFRDRY